MEVPLTEPKIIPSLQTLFYLRNSSFIYTSVTHLVSFIVLLSGVCLNGKCINKLYSHRYAKNPSYHMMLLSSSLTKAVTAGISQKKKYIQPSQYICVYHLSYSSSSVFTTECVCFFLPPQNFFSFLHPNVSWTEVCEWVLGT